MSGNKYEDILEHLENQEKEKAKKMLHLMSSFHPAITYDRLFQRELKGKLLKKKVKSHWYFLLPRLSIVATSFLVLIGMWKMWGDTIVLKQDNPTSAGKEISVASVNQSRMNEVTGAANTSSDLTVQDQAMDSETALATIAPSGTSEEVSSSNTANSIALKRALPKDTKGSEVDLSDEIASISSDIDAIMESSTPPLAPSEAPVATMMMAKMDSFGDPLPTQGAGNAISIDYPGRMATYKKSEAWSENEIAQRSATGMVKSIEKTFTKEELSALLSDKNVIEGSALEYRKAKKDGENAYFLIPCLRYVNIFGDTSFASLVPGYILD